MRRPDGLRGRVAGVAAAGVVLLAGCGGSSGLGGAGASGRTTGTDPSAALNPTAPLTGADASTTAGAGRTGSADGRPAGLRHLQALLVRAERRAGPHLGVLVYDMTSHKALFVQQATVARPPASVAKLFTTVALLRLLGPNLRLHTDVLGTGHLGQGGIWQGDLYLRGDGDPTFGDGRFIRNWDGGFGAQVTALVDQLRARGIRRVSGSLYGDGSRFDAQPGGPFTGGRPDVPDYGGEMSALTFDHGTTAKGLSPPAYAARQLARALRVAHIKVRAARHPTQTPRRARRLARVLSPPLSVLLKLTDVPSDDLFADLLTKQLGYRLAGHGTLKAGAGVILSVLARYHLTPRLEDGSGLAPADRTTPVQVMSLLRQVWPTAIGHMLEAALPVVGVSGTVAGVGLHTRAQARCVAKTGTLARVTNLAGVCAARGGQRVAFVLFIDGLYNWQAIPILSRMVGAIASY